MTPAPTALVARAYAALHHLGHMTFALVDELDAPVIFDRDTNTIWVRKDLTLDQYAVAVREAVDKLCPSTVVIDHDDGTALASRAVGDVETNVPTPRPSLRVV